ncbi:hypothetical protein ABT097_05505, partial [Streptomyces sp. NPDC002225]
DFVNAVLDAVIAIANGGTASVPKMIETALATSIPLLIGFLASLLGINGLANKVKSVFHTVAKPVNRAIDKIINLITKKGKALWNKLKGKEKKGDRPSKSSDHQNNLKAITAPVLLSGSHHTITAKPSGEVRMASREGGLKDKVRSRLAAIAHITPYPSDEQKSLDEILKLCDRVTKEAKKARSGRREDAWSAACQDLVAAVSDYGQRFNKRDIDPSPEENETSERISKRDRKTSPELTALAKLHKGVDCVAILRTSGGTYEGWSSGREKEELNQAAVQQIELSRPKHHYGCAEVLCISKAYESEHPAKMSPVAGATIEMVYAKGDKFGKPYPACRRCEPLLSMMKISISN